MRIVLALDESRYAEAIANWMTGFSLPHEHPIDPCPGAGAVGSCRRAEIRQHERLDSLGDA
jgi:hypothetical protein